MTDGTAFKQCANHCSGIHPFELKEEGDVRKETTAAALRKPLWLENNSSDRGSILNTDPSNYNRHRGQESCAELEKKVYTRKKAEGFFHFIVLLMRLCVTLITF